MDLVITRTAFAHEVIDVDATAGGVSLTGATYSPTDGTKAAESALITVHTSEIRWTLDGTAPVALTTGHFADVGDSIWLTTGGQIAAFRAIEDTATNGEIAVTYFYR